MIYTPKYKTANELLSLTGFSSVTRGYEKLVQLNGKDKIVKNPPGVLFTPKQLKQKLNNYATTRLHAFINLEGEIDLHLDEPHPENKTKHKSRSFCRSVEKMVKEFGRLDKSEKWYVRLIDWLKNLLG